MKPFLFLLFFYFYASISFASGKPGIVVCGSIDNDLIMQLKKSGWQFITVDNPESAFKKAKKGDIVFILASNDSSKTAIKKSFYSLANAKNLKCYVEMPEELPGKLNYGDTFKATLERGVITSGFFGNELPEMNILGLNDIYIHPVNSQDALISIAKVAGFDKADFGLSGVTSYSLLAKINNIIVASSSVSNFRKGRYGPAKSWKIVWERICSWLINKKIVFTDWDTDPRPSYSSYEVLPDNARVSSISRGAEWLYKGRFLIDKGWQSMVLKNQGDGSNPFGPPVSSNNLNGDGSAGVLEGHASKIYKDGMQQYRYLLRCDVQGEVAFLLASAGKELKNKKYLETSEKLLDFMFYTANFRQGPRAEKDKPVYGLLGWAEPYPYIFYGDDNARAVLGAIGASAIIESEKWNQFIADNILANFRISSKEGFLGNTLQQGDIIKNGWQYYNSKSYVNPHPHFESWMWACYLWLYNKTNYAPLLEKAKSAIKITMDNYPANWKWTNGIQQERARMILPLSWLVRIEDTPEHRHWLNTMITDLLKSQQPSGAIQEELGRPGMGWCEAAKSNKEYGLTEAPLISKNGDTVADMLYTSNFAYFALNEAAHATGDTLYFKALEKLSDFLIRIQVKSKNHPDIDGAWFRAFDYSRWEYWASNSDSGWGAWCTLTGWIQSWITSTHFFVENKTSYWDLTGNIAMKKYADQYINEQLTK